MKEVMQFKSSKWLWTVNIIQVRTGSSHEMYGGFAPDNKLFFSVSTKKFEDF